MSCYLVGPWLCRAELFSEASWPSFSHNTQPPSLRQSSPSLKEMTPSLQSSWEAFTSSKATWFNVLLVLLSTTTLLRGCWDLFFVETALKTMLCHHQMVQKQGTCSKKQVTSSELGQLKPPVKVSLFCWGLLLAQRTQSVYLNLVVTCRPAGTKAEELWHSVALLSAGVLIVPRWLCHIPQQPTNLNLVFFG